MHTSIVILSFFFLMNAQAESGKIIEGAMHVVMTVLTQNNSSAVDAPPILSDMIVGQCELDGQSCNGAKVILYNNEGKKVDESTLISQSVFRFSKLKTAQDYNLEVVWHGVIVDHTSVKPGHFVKIKLSDD